MKSLLEDKCKRVGIVLLIIYLLFSLVKQLSVTFTDNMVLKVVSKYYLLPVLWSILIICMLKLIPRVYPLTKITEKNKIYFDALMAAIILTALRYAAGLLLYDLGKSPYDLSPFGIFRNILNILFPLIARELVRAYILNTYGRNKNIVLISCISIVFTLCNLNFNGMMEIKDMESATKYISEYAGPDLCQNFLLSYLAMYGGAGASLIFVCFNYVFQWMNPVLPDLNWLSEGVIGTIVPIYAIPLITNRYNLKHEPTYSRKESRKSNISTGITLIFAILLIWFVVGVFPIVPSVIATGSMEPMIYPGDVVLIEKIGAQEDIDNLKVGDIIQFKRDKILITHRIIDLIKDDKGNISYKTKGDNNSGEDSQIVLPKDIKGTLVTVVPKLGYPTLWLKQSQRIDKKNIEF